MSEELNGDHRIRIYHWWPGREFAGANPIPPLLLAEAERMGSRYLTVAKAENERGFARYGWAFCCPKDAPRRHVGRELALERLHRWLNEGAAA